jgi:alpha-1,3-glucosyltransferase
MAFLSLAFFPLFVSAGLTVESIQSQLLQIFTRLFPFGRGLVHAYWAPNVWALYCFVDKIGAFTLRRIFPAWLPSTPPSEGSMAHNSASGMVGDFQFLLLPRISALHCLLLTLWSLLPALQRILRQPEPTHVRNIAGEDAAEGRSSGREAIVTLLRCLVFASLSTFMFGYHVHEKAVLTPMVLQLLLSAESSEDALLSLLLTQAGGTGLFPLFTGLQELPIKGATSIVLYILHCTVRLGIPDMTFPRQCAYCGVIRSAPTGCCPSLEDSSSHETNSGKDSPVSSLQHELTKFLPSFLANKERSMLHLAPSLL